MVAYDCVPCGAEEEEEELAELADVPPPQPAVIRAALRRTAEARTGRFTMIRSDSLTCATAIIGRRRFASARRRCDFRRSA
jgi:hypothetical protein